MAGDFDGFGGTPMEQAKGFHYVVLNVDPDTKYKFTNGTDFVPDPWSRQYVRRVW
ncbi:MAG: hypothetical protein R3E66_05070 [bacterium]